MKTLRCQQDGDESTGFKTIWGVEGIECGNPLALGSKEKKRMTFLASDGNMEHRKRRHSGGRMKMIRTRCL